MNIVIVGSGNVGSALGRGWSKAGHNVTFASRDPDGAKAADLKKDGFGIAAFAEAARHAEVVVLATPWNAATATVKALGAGGALDGKVLVDATNPLGANLELTLGFDDSAAETIARLATRARVVKAFNTTGANNMANSSYPGGKVVMPLAGDDKAAKETVMRLASDLGFEPVDAGPLTMSRHLEPMAMLWIKLAYAQGLGREIGFALLKR